MQEKRHDFLYIPRAELKGPEMLSLISAMLVGQRVLWQGHPHPAERKQAWKTLWGWEELPGAGVQGHNMTAPHATPHGRSQIGDRTQPHQAGVLQHEEAIRSHWRKEMARAGLENFLYRELNSLGFVARRSLFQYSALSLPRESIHRYFINK